jgi:Uma2 family endonuclease
MGTTTTLLTVQEFLALPESDDQRRELIGGEIFSMGHGGWPHECVKSNINRLLLAWLLQNRLGRVLVETGFQIGEPEFLIPDLSYVSNALALRGTKGQIEGAPDLAIEVVSSEPAARLLKKVGLYLSHGAKSVWVVYPEEQTVWIYSSGHATEFQRDQMLEDPALPGFRAPVSEIFEGI